MIAIKFSVYNICVCSNENLNQNFEKCMNENSTLVVVEKQSQNVY